MKGYIKEVVRSVLNECDGVRERLANLERALGPTRYKAVDLYSVLMGVSRTVDPVQERIDRLEEEVRLLHEYLKVERHTTPATPPITKLEKVK